MLLDKQIEEKGKIAIASAKMAYQSFFEIFSGDRWEALATAGAKVQRPLWASTSTKNPQYRDVMYVEPLIGRETVNTMPDKTAEAFDSHGEVIEDAILLDIYEAEELLDKHKSLLKQATDQLVQEGIQKFIDPFDELLAYIRKKVL